MKSDKTSYEGSKLDILAWSHGLHQLINEQIHLLDSSSSCIDLIFTDQPNLVMESGFQPSLHQNCHHQLVFVKFDLSIYYPSPHRENGKRGNLKTDVSRKQSTPKFPKNKHFLRPDTHTYVCVRIRVRVRVRIRR